MNSALKKVPLGLVILGIVFALSTCSPNAESAVPTKYIQIINIPPEIVNTKAGVNTSKGFNTAYVQLSKGYTASAGAVAEGEATIDPETTLTNGFYTVTIPLTLPNSPSDPYSGTNWNNLAVIISPADPASISIYDIDCKASMSGPSSSSSRS